MEYIKLAGIVLGAHGLWKLVESLLQHRTLKKFKKAEIQNLNANTHDVIIASMMKWQDKMEFRIDELEKNNRELKKIITKQRERINELEKYIEQLEGYLKEDQK